MDNAIYFFYEHGWIAIVAIAALKKILILSYRGLDIPYLMDNFLVVYANPKSEPNEKRRRFRVAHNLFTILFYAFIIAWLAIVGVVRLVR